MKKVIIVLSIFSFFTSCKDTQKDIPEVQTISAIVQDDGSVLVEGSVKSDVGYNGEFGFCLSTEPNPVKQENQLNVYSMNDGKFSSIYYDLEFNATYYVRAWAKNSLGQAYGNIIILDSVRPASINTPCKPASNTLDNGISGGVQNVSKTEVDNDNNYWTGGFSLPPNYAHFKFSEKPKPGIYKTTISWNPDSKSVYTEMEYTSSSGSAKAGQNVYVNRLANGDIEITTCSLQINYNGIVKNLTTRFTCSGK